ncbi:MAG: DNA methyltransferase [Armatimonadota bacterium]
MEGLRDCPADHRPYPDAASESEAPLWCSSYFTRRSWHVIQTYLRNFSEPGDLVLDPFGGVGVTAIESLVLRRRCVHLDINPLANFVTNQVAIAPVDLAALAKDYDRLRERVTPLIHRAYKLDLNRLERLLREVDYPRDPIPVYVDQTHQGTVDNLFTPRQLYSLAIIRHFIMTTRNEISRNLLLLAFSGNVGQGQQDVHISSGAEGKPWRATMFSIFKYVVPKEPVELHPW